VNSAISAFYYLQLVAVPMLGQPNARTESVQAVPSSWPRLAAVVCGVGVLVMPLGLQALVKAAGSSTSDAIAPAEKVAERASEAGTKVAAASADGTR
jgi:NADH:ubiquinone oxidoreductase subunit 2 (subunit N)